jgi:hypothetical protein
MLEAAVESASVKHAAKFGVLSFKLQGYVVGDPDRAFLLPGRRLWLVEFKSTAGRLTPRQKIRHAELAAAGHPVSVVRSTHEFTRMLADMLYTQA